MFNFPLHPYTRSLLSAIPIPDPELEKNKVLFTYDPSIHDYSESKPSLENIGYDHFVYGNEKELEEYRTIRESGVPLKSVTLADPATVDTEVEESEEMAPGDYIIDAPAHDTGSIWYTILSFLLPVLGIPAWLIFKHRRYMRNYKACKKGSLIGLGVIGAILAIFLIALPLALI